MPSPKSTKPIYYLDACVFIDLIEYGEGVEPAATIAAAIQDAEDGHCELVTSAITMLEVLWAKREKDRGALDPEVEAKIQKLWHPGSSPIRIVEAHELLIRRAQALLRHHLHQQKVAKTKGVDALHLVTAQDEAVDEFFTTEAAMDKWGQILGFKVTKPHRPPRPADQPGLFAEREARTPSGARTLVHRGTDRGVGDEKGDDESGGSAAEPPVPSP